MAVLVGVIVFDLFIGIVEVIFVNGSTKSTLLLLYLHHFLCTHLYAIMATMHSLSITTLSRKLALLPRLW